MRLIPETEPLVRDGVAHFNEGRHDRALKCFARALARGQGGAPLRCFMAHSLHALGRGAQARHLMAELVRKEPDYVPARLGLASFLRLQGRHRQAAQVLREAVRVAPGCRPARRALGEVLRGLALERKEAEDRRGARGYWSELLERLPGHREARRELRELEDMERRRLLEREARRVAAAARLRREAADSAVRRPRKNREDVLLEKTQEYQSRGHWAKARRLLGRVLKSYPGSLRAWLRLSQVRWHMGDRKGSRLVLRKASRLDPEAIADGGQRFHALLMLGRFEEAFKLGERLLDDPPFPPNRGFWWFFYDRRSRLGALEHLARSRASPWACYYRALLNGAEGAATPGEREMYYLERLADFDSSRYGWMNIRAGQAFLLAGYPRMALRALEAAMSYRPIDWPAYCYMAETLICLGRPAEARRQMEKAEAAAPSGERVQVLAWRGELELWLGNYDEALRILDAACSQGAIFAFCWRGAAALKQGDPRRALKYLDEAVAKCPIDLESLVWRGEAKRELGLHRQALRDLERVPDWVWGRWNRALVMAALRDDDGLKKEFKRLPDYMIAYLRRQEGLAPEGPLDSGQMERVLQAGIRLSRGFRRSGYRQAVWIPGAS